MKTLKIIACLLLVAANLYAQKPGKQANTNPPPPPNLGKKYQVILPIQPRFQWEPNGGYCGEISLISAGLNYGQYLSQFDVRTIASPGMPQNNQTAPGVVIAPNTASYNSQLLLGINDKAAADSLRLESDTLSAKNSVDFLKWVKKHLVAGHPVVIGVFNNECQVYGDSTPTDGDDEFDHITPVLGWASDIPLDKDDKLLEDIILISDNGLYGPDTLAIPDTTVQYYYSYTLKSFLADRQKANNCNGNTYSLLDLPKGYTGGKRNYAIAITGIKDVNKETFPVNLTTSINYEAPRIAWNGSERPAPIAMTLTITVSGLTAGKNYNLYYYTHEKEVPVKNFNGTGKTPWKIINATGPVWTGTITIMSNQKVIFRAVEALNQMKPPAKK